MKKNPFLNLGYVLRNSGVSANPVLVHQSDQL